MSLDRYLRQTVLPEVGKAGQEKLSQARVLCVGVGGLGSPAALYLAAAGVGCVGLIDPDRVDETNLQRQILFQETDQHELKVHSAKERLLNLNSSIIIHAIPERLGTSNALSLFSEYDVILDGTDSFSAKYLINDAAVKTGRPVVYGSISQMEGQLSVFGAEEGPCYRCLYPAQPKTWVPNCAEAGVLGAVAGVIGSMQALEAMKIILGLPTLTGKLLFWDALSMKSRTVALRRDPSCPTCSKPRDLIELTESPLSCQQSRDQDDSASQGFREISADELYALLSESKVQLIDVREPHEWCSGKIPGAKGYPLTQIITDLEEGALQRQRLKRDFTRPTVFYCQSGIRSQTVIKALLQADSSLSGRLSHLRDGLALWPFELSE